VNKSGIKLIDFGSACFEDEVVYTYIQSWFYWAPEVILGLKFNGSIDMWSFGCILAELYTGYPLFPGESEGDQLSLIMELFGKPSKDVLVLGKWKHLFFDEMDNITIKPNSKGKIWTPGARVLSSTIKCQDMMFLDFLKGCLVIDPWERMSPLRAL